jgi:hypothetical protein
MAKYLYFVIMLKELSEPKFNKGVTKLLEIWNKIIKLFFFRQKHNNIV